MGSPVSPHPVRFAVHRVLAAAVVVLASACVARSPPRAAEPDRPHTYVVCASGTRDPGCDFKGDGAIQAAVDRAVDGDTVLIRAGTYVPRSYRDVPYKDFSVRGYLVIENKRLTITGAPSTDGRQSVVLDGGKGLPATAIVLHHADVRLQGLEIESFRYELPEDDIYDGHGIFVIDSKVRIDTIVMRGLQKMALTGRGDSLLDVSHLRVSDGHLGIWLHEWAYLRLRDCVVRGNDSSGLAAYDNAVAHVVNCVFDGNRDDGLYTENHATVYTSDTLLLRNAPIAAHANSESRIELSYGALFANGADTAASEHARVSFGTGMVREDPRVDADYEPLQDSPLLGHGDPELPKRW